MTHAISPRLTWPTGLCGSLGVTAAALALRLTGRPNPEILKETEVRYCGADSTWPGA
jgi:hypothetical protein